MAAVEPGSAGGTAPAVPTARRLGTQAAWNAANWVALSAYGFASATIIFRLEGSESYGIWATIAALRGFLVVLDGGLAIGITRDTVLASRGQTEARKRIAGAHRLYLGLGAAALLLGLAAAGVPGALLGVTGELADVARGVTMVMGVETTVIMAGAPLMAIIRGRQRFEVLAFGSSVLAVVGVLLLLPLTLAAGLLGAAVAGLAARALVALLYVGWVWRDDIRMLTLRAPSAATRAVFRFAAPIWLIGVGMQLGLRTDVPIVGAVAGVAAAGHYAVGATLPFLGAGLLWVVIDTAFPAMAAANHAELAWRMGRLMTAGCALAGLGFGTLILLGRTVLGAWLDTSPPLAVVVLSLYSIVWAINVPTHVLAIGSMVLERQGVLTPVVIIEAVSNLALSIVLAIWIGPLGPAIATVSVLSVTNLVVIPLLLMPHLPLEWREVALAAAKGYALGVVGAIAIWVVVTSLNASTVVTLILAGSGMLVVLVAFVRLRILFR